MFLDIAPDALFTGFVELGDAVAFDIRFAFDPKLLLYLEFDWQTVSIPAAAGPGDMLAAHAMIAYDGILDYTCLDAVDAWAAIGGGWPLEKDKGAGAVTAGKGFIDNIVLQPPLFDALL